MDNTPRIESVQPFFVDSRSLGEFDARRNYGESECDRYFADPVSPAEITWAAHSDEPGIVTTIAYSPVTGEALGVVAVMPDGAVRASRACAGGVLATETAAALLRGEGDPWATSVYWEGAREVTVIIGCDCFLEVAALADPRAAIIGLARWDDSARAMLRRALPEGWELHLDPDAAKAVLQ